MVAAVAAEFLDPRGCSRAAVTAQPIQDALRLLHRLARPPA